MAVSSPPLDAVIFCNILGRYLPEAHTCDGLGNIVRARQHPTLYFCNNLSMYSMRHLQSRISWLASAKQSPTEASRSMPHERSGISRHFRSRRF